MPRNANQVVAIHLRRCVHEKEAIAERGGRRSAALTVANSEHRQTYLEDFAVIRKRLVGEHRSRSTRNDNRSAKGEEWERMGENEVRDEGRE